MTVSQACDPCAKRKVRCDHGEPCSNCKRRKTDCTYSTVTPQDRIAQLEALVRDLRNGQDRNFDSFKGEKRLRQEDHDVDAVASGGGSLLLASLQSQSRGQQIFSPPDLTRKHNFGSGKTDETFPQYSRTWQGWMGNSNDESKCGPKLNSPQSLQERSDAFASTKLGLPGDISYDQHPTGDIANSLWDIFMDRVEPMVRICYRWWLKDFRKQSVELETCEQISAAEQALLRAIYLISVVSMSDKECRSLLSQSRKAAISQYQYICENAMLRTNLFCMNDILAVKAVIIYVTAGYDRLSTQSLWSLTGLAIRNSERLGLHRDGVALNLDSVQTEDRRRVWWQLLVADQGVAISSGSASTTLVADWDVKLPLNIEDSDIEQNSMKPPQERKGLTSMSIFRFFCFLFKHQRNMDAGEGGASRLGHSKRDSVFASASTDFGLERLERPVNKEFLQFCDPIEPLHMFLLNIARSLIACMKLWILHTTAYKNDKADVNSQYRDEILETSVKCIKYNIALRSHPELQQYQWQTRACTPFHALVCVLVEAAHEEHAVKSQELWDLLSKMYAANTTLWELSDDRRNFRAAELVVSAWKTRQAKAGSALQPANPGFVEALEEEIAKKREPMDGEVLHGATQQQSYQSETMLQTPQSIEVEQDIEAVFDMDFQDIDWSYWSSID